MHLQLFTSTVLCTLLLLSCIDVSNSLVARRQALAAVPAAAFGGFYAGKANAAEPPRQGPDLKFIETSSGLKYADAKVGTGKAISLPNSPVTVDYVLSTTGARYGSKIYSTADKNEPYRFKVGDGSTIQGLEMAVVGDSEIEPMKPGGIRRVIIPASLGYESLAKVPSNCLPDKGIGPIPPATEGSVGEYYQRFKNIYCNPNRQYQPDVIIDLKLYGARS